MCDKTKMFGFFLIYAQWNSPSPCRCHVQVVKFHPSFSHPLDNYVILKFSKVYSYSMVFFSKWAICLVTCFDVVCNWRVIPALPLLLNATTFYTHQPPSKIVYLTYMTYFFFMNDIWDWFVFFLFFVVLKARLYNFINDAKLYSFSGSQKFFFDSRENARWKPYMQFTLNCRLLWHHWIIFWLRVH